ncbi:MAG: hypothetical protein E7398_00335 [Ruminococcaceae bacterium]|nr:hypothetical protein [Oscillospiraceae bacterium]
MKEFIKRVSNLLCIKSIVTLSLTYVFCRLAITGGITPAEFVAIFIVVINFYFEAQRNKKAETEEKEV